MKAPQPKHPHTGDPPCCCPRGTVYHGLEEVSVNFRGSSCRARGQRSTSRGVEAPEFVAAHRRRSSTTRVRLVFHFVMREHQQARSAPPGMLESASGIAHRLLVVILRDGAQLMRHDGKPYVHACKVLPLPHRGRRHGREGILLPRHVTLRSAHSWEAGRSGIDGLHARRAGMADLHDSTASSAVTWEKAITRRALSARYFQSKLKILRPSAVRQIQMLDQVRALQKRTR